MAVKEYDPKQIAIIFAGIPITGFADGEFVTVEYDNDAFSDMAGTDGEVSRARSSDERATVTFKLAATSASNARLSALARIDRVTPGGAGVGFLSITNLLNRATAHEAEDAWIASMPSVSYDRTVGSREWKIRAAKMVSFEAGA